MCFAGMKGWFFGGDSSVRRAIDKNEQHSAVIRGVPLEVSDSDMTSALTDNFPGVRIRRFVRSDGKSLQMSSWRFPQNPSLTRQQPTEFSSKICTIIQSNPYGKEYEKSAATDVRSSDTSVPIAIRVCYATIAPASTLSITAKVISLTGVPVATKLIFPKQVQRVYEARGLQEKLRETLCQKMMANAGSTFLQIN